MLLYIDRSHSDTGVRTRPVELIVLSQSTDVQRTDRHGRMRVRVEPRLTDCVQAVAFNIT